jgi:hypothetical protein
MDAERSQDDQQSDHKEPKRPAECAGFERADAHQWNICAAPG